MQIVFMVSVIVLNAIMLIVIVLSAIIPSAIGLFVIILSDILLNGILLCVILLIVMAPSQRPFEIGIECEAILYKIHKLNLQHDSLDDPFPGFKFVKIKIKI